MMMMMIQQKPATGAQAEAKTWVLWDIKSCPVPDGCDASRVGPCIRRCLKNSGYDGVVTITAIGMLTDLPVKLLQSVSSTGIDLCLTPSKMAITSALLCSTVRNPDLSPQTTNILVISPDNNSFALKRLEKEGYNVIPQAFRDYSPIATAATSAQVESFWKNFLEEDKMDSEEKCSETCDWVWVCRECQLNDVLDFSGKGFDNFINHVSRDDHNELMLDYLHPSERNSYLEKSMAFRDFHLKNAIPSVNKQPKRRCDVNHISVGSGTNIQDNTLVHVAKTNISGKVLPTLIGDNVTVGHSAVIHGCTVDDEAFVGMGATLLDGVVVEKHAMVAAGSLVKQNTRIPSGEVWGGNPAKFMRKLTEEEIAYISQSAKNYINLAQIHATENSKSFKEIEVERGLRRKYARKDEDYDSMLGITREIPAELILPDNVLPCKAASKVPTTQY